MSDFVKMDDVKAGTLLRADDSFDCLEQNSVVCVEQDEQGLYVPCADGKHHLDGQNIFPEDGDEYVGFTKVDHT